MARLVITVAAIALVTSGCTFLQNLGLGPGAVRVPGQVTFHDTGIGLKAVVIVNLPVITSSTGHFVLSLAPNRTYTWRAQTLVGSGAGSFPAAAGARLDIRIPPFAGWDARHFNEVVVDPDRRVTVRWPDGATIPYWLEQGDPAVLPEYHKRAEEALRDWQSVLEGTVRFVPASSPADAAKGLVILWEEWDTFQYDGMCERTWDLGSGRILGAVVKIHYRAAGNAGLYRHEIGHCIGLNHSSDPHFLMYPRVSEQNQHISPVEQSLARLLYAAAPKTPALPGVAAWDRADSVPPVYEDVGIITQTLY